MKIDLTKRQGEEFNNDFWHIAYTVTIDTVEHNGFTDEDDFHDIPSFIRVGTLGYDEVTDTYAISHNKLTWEDEVILKHVLDERVAIQAGFRALPAGERPAARSAYRTQARIDARVESRRADRVRLRRANRRDWARREHRAELEAIPEIAGKIVAEQLVQDAILPEIL